MNKILLPAALAAALAATAFAPTAQAANSGTITFSGKVLADTCVISVNGGNTVVLPTVMTGAFGAAVGNTAGTTPSFSIALSGCDNNTTSAQMAFNGANIDGLTGNLKNTAASGSNVQVQLLDSSNNVINTSTGTNAPSIAVSSGAGSTSLKAQYISTSTTTTAGLVSSSVGFTLTYL